MLNQFYFTERVFQIGFNITLFSHHFNHANSKLNNKSNFSEFGIEFRDINKIMKKKSIVQVSMINQNKLKYQTTFAAMFDKQDEDNQVLHESELFIEYKL